MKVLITGASSGFGREFARQLAPHAASLVLVALDREGLEKIATALKADFPRLEIDVCPVDLSENGDREAFCADLARRGTGIHFLINNAGLGDIGRFVTADPGKLRRIFAVNVLALTALTYRILPLMPKAGNRAILNVSSLAGVFPSPFLAAYAASKAYVSSFSESLRIELKGKGITVTAVCPGPVDTGFGTVANRQSQRALPGPDWFKGTPELVVSRALEAVACGRARVIPGLPAAIFALLFSLVPMMVLRRILPAGAPR